VGSESHVLTHCYGQMVCIRGTLSAGNHAEGLIQILPVNVTDFAEGGIRNYVFGKQKEVDNELAKYPKHNVSRDDNEPNSEEDSGTGEGNKPGPGSSDGGKPGPGSSDGGKPGPGSGGGGKPGPGSSDGSKPGPGSGGGGKPGSGSDGGGKPGPGSGGGGSQKPSNGGQGSGGGGYGKDTSDIQSELDSELKYSRDRTEVAHRSHSGSEQLCCSQILLALMFMFFFQMV